MPLVRIHVSDNYGASTLSAVGDGVHDAMVATIDVPQVDRFQVITEHKAGEQTWDHTFLGIARSDRAVFVEITLSFGRDVAKKRSLYARIVENLERDAGVRSEDVLIVLVETARENWSFGNGIAQYAPHDEASVP